PVKNSERLTRTEINRAYRTADQVAWENNPMILGYEIRLSASNKAHIRCELCRTLAGKYPASFQWAGWHPNCYSDDTEVMTNNGWKLFKDVLNDDLIMSLDPVSKQPEYVPFVAYI